MYPAAKLPPPAVPERERERERERKDGRKNKTAIPVLIQAHLIMI